MRTVKHVCAESIQAIVEHGAIAKYRISARLSFVVEPNQIPD